MLALLAACGGASSPDTAPARLSVSSDADPVVVSNSVTVTVTPRSPGEVLDLSSTTDLPGTERDYLVGQTTGSYPYAEYLPAGYDAGSGKRWPLILSLHGDLHGPAGLTTQDMQILHGINYFTLLRETPATYVNAVMIGPTRGTESFHWDIPQTCAFVDYLVARYRIDARRIYIVGQSDGGRGAWTVSSHCPDKIAAILTGSSYPVPDGPVMSYQNFLDQRVAVWHTNRDDDGTAARLNPYVNDYLGTLLGATNGWRDDNPPGSPSGTAHFDDATRRWVWTGNVSATGPAGTSSVHGLNFTTFPNGGHDTWTFINHNRDMLDWLFKQVKGGAPAAASTVTSAGLGAAGTIDGPGQLVVNGVDVYKGTAVSADAGNIAAAINAAGIEGVTATASNVAVGRWAMTTDQTAAYYVNYRFTAMAVTGNRDTDVHLYMSFINNGSARYQLSAADNGDGMTLTAVDGHNILLGGPWNPSAIGLGGLPWGTDFAFPFGDAAQLAVVRGKYTITRGGTGAGTGLVLAGSRLAALGLRP